MTSTSPPEAPRSPRSLDALPLSIRVRRVSEIESRFDSLRQLGFTEQQIVDMVHRELARARKEAVSSPQPDADAPALPRGKTGSGRVPSADGRSRGELELNRMPRGRRTPVDWNPTDLVLNVDSHYEHHEWYSGPHPHPALAREYEKLCPGFMDRQLRMQEEELRVRWRVLDRRDSRLERGQRYALIAALSVMASGAFIAWLGSPGTGASLIGGVVVALVSAFLYRQQTVRKQVEANDGAPELNEAADDKAS